MVYPQRTHLSLFSVFMAGIALVMLTFFLAADTETSRAKPAHQSQNKSPFQNEPLVSATQGSQSLSDVVQVSVGHYHACALQESGDVLCWGGNQWGQLGTGNRLPSTTAVKAVGLPQDIVAVDAGEDHTCALTGTGDIKCWGSGYTGQLGDGMVSGGLVPSDVSSFSNGAVSIAVGGAHACGLSNSGTMKCWGGNHFGELGNGLEIVSQTLPVDVTALEDTVQSMGVGSNHTCALTKVGGVKCWGQNSFGEVGNGSTDDQSTPQDVFELTADVRDITAGAFRTCAIMESGNAKCWGHGGFGALGDGRAGHSSTPVNVINLSSTVKAISIGPTFTCALLDSSGVECWGGNSDGQLGNGTTMASADPVGVTGLASGVSDISSASTQSCIVLNGGVKCWGKNPFGDQSNEAFLNSPVPVEVLVSGQTEPLAPPSNFSCSEVTQIPQTECTALVSFYNSLDGLNWTNSSGWLQNESPCSWHGVSCDSGRVVGLTLRENGLLGTLPASLVDLPRLRLLALTNNRISGEIPAVISSSSSMERLSLSGNRLSGMLPDELSALSQLLILELDNNRLEGGIPSAIGALTNLEHLNLGENLLTGELPLELTTLTGLETLKLYSNELTGTIPSELGNLRSLEILRIEENSLEGSLPASIGNLTELTYLSLPNNMFSGAIPAELGNLSKLTYVDLQNNQLTGSIPLEIGNLAALEQLTISSNLLEGEIPSSLGNLTEATKLYLQDNKLTGTIPAELGMLINIVDLRVNNNKLSGPLPSDLAGLLKVEELHYRETDLCEPSDAAFQQWLTSIENVTRTNVSCDGDVTPPLPSNPTVQLIGDDTGAPGSTFVIKGSGFPAAAEVNILMDSKKSVVVQTNSDGEFWLVLITKAEADAGGYTVTVADAGSITITLDANSEVNQEEAPADQKSSTVQLEVPSTQVSSIMLPYLANVPAPQPPPALTWESVGEGPLLVRSLNMSNGTLFAAEQQGTGIDGGLYQKSLSGCNPALAFSRVPAVEGNLLSVDFSGSQGVAAAFDDGIYYLNGSDWSRVERDTLGDKLGAVYTVSFVDGAIYAGANDLQNNVETDGKIYKSTDGGATWAHLLDTPAVMNVIKPVSVSLWLGTDGAGIQLWTDGSVSLVPINTGLAGEALKVWDMVIPEVNRFYIATNGGVYQRTGTNGAWTPLGANLRDTPTRSLAAVGDNLYVGTLNNGVHRISLTSQESWIPVANGPEGSAGWEVRDLFYDDTYCNGLLAGTKQGVWVLR